MGPDREIPLSPSLGREAVDRQLVLHLPQFLELNIISQPHTTKRKTQDIDSSITEVLKMYIQGPAILDAAMNESLSSQEEEIEGRDTRGGRPIIFIPSAIPNSIPAQSRASVNGC